MRNIWLKIKCRIGIHQDIIICKFDHNISQVECQNCRQTFILNFALGERRKWEFSHEIVLREFFPDKFAG